jgi:transposase
LRRLCDGRREQERFRQETPGRPGPTTRYVKNVSTRFDLDYDIDVERLFRQRQGDGVFPLVSNDRKLSELEVLHAYKRQPTIEKRFSQLKTDFSVAPVYLKRVHRIQSLLCLYFFALLIEALLERELRRGMKREGIENLPMYPEGRACRWPTTRRLIDLFEPIQRHTLTRGLGMVEVMGTELTKLQRNLLKLLGISPTIYDC